jgi:3',5'-cyclic AMP phosphodiesterase CpdA
MRTLLHLSDLHFGRVDQALLAPLIELAQRLRPDLVAVSGDLTQRARSTQFREARAFLDALPTPQLIVPGNHDVPLLNVLARFIQPLNKYRRYITDDLQPSFQDEELIALGLNTARSLTIHGGRLNRAQVRWAQRQLGVIDRNVFKLVVSHHPFDVPPGHNERHIVGRAAQAMLALAECGTDIFLAGHLHLSHTGQTAKRYHIAGHSALVIQAGTAVSTRHRGELNSFNVLTLAFPRVTVERYVWQTATQMFAKGRPEEFERRAEGWLRLTART